VTQPDDASDLEQAAKLVLRDEPVYTLERFFHSRKEAVQFYAATRAQQFALGRLAENCCQCQDKKREIVGELQWHAFFTRFSFRGSDLLIHLAVHLHISIRNETVGFCTFHSFCAKCWRRTRRRAEFGVGLEAFSFLLLLVGLAATLIFGIESISINGLTPFEKAELCGFCVTGLVMVGASIWLGRQSQFLRVPTALRYIAPQPFLAKSVISMKEMPAPNANSPQTAWVHQYGPAEPGRLAWQPAIGILVVVFAGIPMAIMAFGDGTSPDGRQIARRALLAFVVLIVAFIASYIRRRRRIRSVYYAQSVKSWQAAQVAPNHTHPSASSGDPGQAI